MQTLLNTIINHLKSSGELLAFLWHRRQWWLVPMIMVWALLPLMIVLFFVGVLCTAAKVVAAIME